MTEKHCPYCEFDEYDVIHQNDFGAILPEAHPLSKGHSVIIPVMSALFLTSLIRKEKA